MAFDADGLQMFAALFKGDTFAKYGLFDGDNVTPIGMEGEFAERLRAAGRKVRVVPRACVCHGTRMLSPENPNQLTYAKAVKATEFVNSVNAEFKGAPKKYVIYTFVREGESLPKFREFDDSVSYVCFTSDAGLYSKRGIRFPWRIFRTSDLAEFLKCPENSLKMKEFIKLNPHLLLKSFGISIWVDPAYDVEKDLTELSRLMDPSCFMLALDDARSDCLYRRLVEARGSSRMQQAEFEGILQAYRSHRYPPGNGLADTSVLIRKHADGRCRDVMEKVWGLTQSLYPDSGLFLNYVLWLEKFDYSCVPANLVLNSFIRAKEEKRQ